MSAQDIITVISIDNSITFTFDATIDDTTPVTVTLSPNGMGEGSIGDGVVISGLMPDTLYTYTVSFVYNNISYLTQSFVTTQTAPTISSTTSISGMDEVCAWEKISHTYCPSKNELTEGLISEIDCKFPLLG